MTDREIQQHDTFRKFGYLPIGEAGRKFGVSYFVLNKLVRSRRIGSVKLSPKLAMINTEDLKRVLPEILANRKKVTKMLAARGVHEMPRPENPETAVEVRLAVVEERLATVEGVLESVQAKLSAIETLLKALPAELSDAVRKLFG